MTTGLGDSEWVREGLGAAADRGREIAQQVSPHVGSRASWHFEALPGTGGGSFSSAVYRMHYSPTQGTTTPPSAIVKIIRRQDQDPSGVHYWRRESEAYRCGDLRELMPAGLTLPACYFSADLELASVIVVEDVGSDDRLARTMSWYGRFAEQLGRMNGTPYDSRTQPAWFSSDFVGGQARASSLSVPSLLAHPSTSIASFCTDGNRDQVLAMAQQCEPLIAALAELPLGVSHLDSFSRNVTQRGNEFVLFDWALVGLAPVGADLAALFLLSVFHFDVEERDWSAFADAVFEGYRVGLREVGCPVLADDLQFAFDATLALRWLGFLGDALPAFEHAPEVLEAVTGRPIDDLLARLQQFADFVRPQVAAAIGFVAR